MLRKLTFAILVLQYTCFCFLEAQTQNTPQQVAERLQEFINVVNKGESEAITAFWTDNATATEPNTHELLKGKIAIQEHIKSKLEQFKNNPIHFSFKPSEIRFPSENTANVAGIIEISRNGTSIQNIKVKAELLKQNGQWLLTSVE